MASDSGTGRNSDTGSSPVPADQKPQIEIEPLTAPNHHEPTCDTTASASRSYNENRPPDSNVVIKEKEGLKDWIKRHKASIENRKIYDSQSHKSKKSKLNLK